MAKVSDRTIPYEVLIRFDDDGALKGAHLVKRRIVEVDGERLRDETGIAQPLSLIDAAEGLTLSALLGEVGAALQAYQPPPPVEEPEPAVPVVEAAPSAPGKTKKK